MWGIKYECGWIKNNERFEPFKFFIQSKQTTTLTFLLPNMFYLIDETMNVSDKVWMWVHQKYVISWIIRNLYWGGKNNCTYLDVTNDLWFNQQKNECK